MHIRTLTGDVEPKLLGNTLIHEHLAVDWGEMLGRPKIIDFEYSAMRDKMVAKLNAAYEHGVGAMVECTPIGCGRYVDLFQDVAEQTPVKIVCSTGFFHESWCPMHPIARAFDIDMMADLFVREITEGMGDTLIKAGIIKCATGEGRVSTKEEQVLRAAARAHLKTGCPIITHTTGGLGNEQLDIFESEGVAPAEVIISHVGCEKDDWLAYSESLLRRGANISFDRIGEPSFGDDDHWIMLLTNAIQKGYLRQAMFSHDSGVVVHGYNEIVNPGVEITGDFTYISREFLPKLKQSGVTDEQVHVMFHENPQRVLAF
jgi:phosphotriesterase-related protein